MFTLLQLVLHPLDPQTPNITGPQASQMPFGLDLFIWLLLLGICCQAAWKYFCPHSTNQGNLPLQLGSQFSKSYPYAQGL